MIISPAQHLVHIVQSAKPPFSEQQAAAIKQNFVEDANSSLARRLRRAIARAKRQLSNNPQRPQTAALLKRDPERASSYAFGAFAVLAIALYLSYRRGGEGA